jgi:hypothetical protein
MIDDIKKSVLYFGREPEGRRSLGISSQRWKDDTKMGLNKTGNGLDSTVWDIVHRQVYVNRQYKGYSQSNLW